MEFEELKTHDGEEVTLLGKRFRFCIESDLGGEWAIFYCLDEPLEIWATLNYDIRGIPISLRVNGEVIGYDAYQGEVENWNHYLKIVEEKTFKLLLEKAKQNR